MSGGIETSMESITVWCWRCGNGVEFKLQKQDRASETCSIETCRARTFLVYFGGKYALECDTPKQSAAQACF